MKKKEVGWLDFSSVRMLLFLIGYRLFAFFFGWEAAFYLLGGATLLSAIMDDFPNRN